MLLSEYNEMTEKEKKFIFDTFMDFFDGKISHSNLYEKLKSQLSSYSRINFFDDFCYYFSDYAKEKYNIDDLRLYVEQKKLYSNCFEVYIKYINREITTGKYLDNIELLNLPINAYHDIVFDYARDVKKLLKIEVKQLRSQGNTMRNTLNLIYNTSDEKEIFEILTDFGRHKSKGIKYGNRKLLDLKTYVHDFLIIKYKDTISFEEYNKKLLDLREKIAKVSKTYFDIQNKQLENEKKQEREENLNTIKDAAKNLVIDFLNSKMSLKKFVAAKHTSYNTFRKAVELIKDDTELYNRYISYIENKKNTQYAYLICKVTMVIDGILNGVIDEVTNEKRDFDIVDYYANLNLSFNDFYDIIKNKYNSNELRIIKTFFAKNKGFKDDTKTIREMKKYTVNKIEVTEEQKEEVIAYLKKIHAPVTMNIFRIAIRRYLNNGLVIEEKMKSK